MGFALALDPHNDSNTNIYRQTFILTTFLSSGDLETDIFVEGLSYGFNVYSFSMHATYNVCR